MLVPQGRDVIGHVEHSETLYHRDSLLGAFVTKDGRLSVGMTPLGSAQVRKHNGRKYGKVRGRAMKLADGDAGTRQTLELMKTLALEGTQHGDIWQLSRELVGGSNPVEVHDQASEAQRLLSYVQELRWTPDTGHAETVAAPWRTLQVRAGDCDDLSTLLASLGVSIGLETRFKAIASNPDFKQDFSHVYLQFKIGDQWISAEPSIKGVPLGWESPTIFRTMTKNVWAQ